MQSEIRPKRTPYQPFTKILSRSLHRCTVGSSDLIMTNPIDRDEPVSPLSDHLDQCLAQIRVTRRVYMGSRNAFMTAFPRCWVLGPRSSLLLSDHARHASLSCLRTSNGVKSMARSDGEMKCPVRAYMRWGRARWRLFATQHGQLSPAFESFGFPSEGSLDRPPPAYPSDQVLILDAATGVPTDLCL